MQSSIYLTALLSVLSAQPVLADISSCPGVYNIAGPAQTGCCVGATPQSVVLSTCPGWPICTGPATTTVTRTPLACATYIPLTADNYYGLISSASNSLKESGTNIRTIIGQGASDNNPTAAVSRPLFFMPSGSPRALLLVGALFIFQSLSEEISSSRVLPAKQTIPVCRQLNNWCERYCAKEILSRVAQMTSNYCDKSVKNM
ncbi:hypothetical protein BT63DRAFT_452743 [Microthyrium microscopicum]|uniref:Extracellular membrane protein CFEM domain-containing protein n=1 Tax=Microthyrium microscopicum TaxID=703497 RepID=A0A6A6UJ34_9PEZI|nr:hypothetical protein BT63DRAFT_452743 [Microthyrium microscopicum]